MPLRCATMSGVTLLGDALSVRQSLQDAQDLRSVFATAQQGKSKVKGHGCARIVDCGLVGVFKGAPVPIVSGCQMGRRSAGEVEGDHGLCLCQGAEELGAPLTLIVGHTVADFVADHRIR